MISRPFGFNVITSVSANAGIGVSTRHLIQLFLERGCPVAILDIDPGLGRGRHDLRFEPYFVKSFQDLPYAVNLFINNAAFILESLVNLDSSFFFGGRLNSALIWWELPVLPNTVIPALEFLDVLIAPSTFIRATLDSRLSGLPTISAVHPFYCPSGIAPSRRRFGLPEDGILFVTSFEPHSDPVRKNTLAVIDAFVRAFRNSPTTFLVVKINNARVDGEDHPFVQKLKAVCAGHSNILLIDKNWSYADVLSLYASCDVFVSLHRSEGLGLGLMEAMALGKPLIATAWSGNMSFMDHTNSCAVGYKLVPVEATLHVYSRSFLGETAVWAEPNIEEAIAWMRKLATDPEFRSQLGRKAAADIGRHHNTARQGTFIDEIRALWEQREFIPEVRENRQVALRSLQKTYEARYMTPTQRVVQEMRVQLDRHVLWRLRK